MARKKPNDPATRDSTAHLGFEEEHWFAADNPRSNMDAAEQVRSGDSQPQAARRLSKPMQYGNLVPGLVFLKCSSASFEVCHGWLELLSPTGRNPGDEGNPTKTANYADAPEFCKSATTEEIASHGCVLSPGRYVCAEAGDNGGLCEENMSRLVAELNGPFAKSDKPEAAIHA
jgi:hypothetical protein